jgi:hypothetical protein
MAGYRDFPDIGHPVTLLDIQISKTVRTFKIQAKCTPAFNWP